MERGERGERAAGSTKGARTHGRRGARDPRRCASAASVPAAAAAAVEMKVVVVVVEEEVRMNGEIGPSSS